MTTTLKTPGADGTRVGVVDRVRMDLEEAILSGRWPAGARVNADDCARRLGVSHIPVREALRALQAEGWIVRRPYQGAFVRGRDPSDLADLFEARLYLEGHAAALAAERRTAPQLDELDAILARQAETADPDEIARVNAEFHLCLANCAQNAVLTGYLHDLGKRVRFYFLPAAAQRRTNSLAEHRGILAAVRRRDAAQAQALICAHVSDTRSEAGRTLAAPVGPSERGN